MINNKLMEVRSELLLIKEVLDGYKLAKKSPKYLVSAIELYGETYGDTHFQETVDRINKMITESFS